MPNPMRKLKPIEWILFLVIASLVSAVFVLAVLIHGSEPRYQRRSLTAWLRQVEQLQSKPVEAEAARSAVIAMGTNALPFLLEWTEYPAPDLKSRLIDRLQQARRTPLGRLCIPELVTRDSRYEHFRLAGVGFGILGPLAAPCAPELSLKLRSAEHWFTAQACVCDLQAIGPKGVPYLCEIITNVPPGGWTNFPNWTVSSDMSPRVTAIKLLAALGTNAGPMMPVFIRATKDEELSVATHAIMAVGLTGHGHPAVLSALTNALQDSRSIVRAYALDSLSRLGSEAAPALNSILRALCDEDATVRRSASNALAVISPGALQKNLVQEVP